MNEYIIHGKTGILYDPDNPQPLEFSNIKDLGSNARKYIEQGHPRWLAAQKELIDFINQPAVKPSLYKYLPCKLLAATKKKVRHHFPALVNFLIKVRKFIRRNRRL